MRDRVPTFDELMNPLLEALRLLGGSGSIDEIYEKVVEIEKFSDEVISQIHDPEKSNRSEIEYRLAWARTYLKQYGHVDNSSRGVWVLTEQGRNTPKINPSEVVKYAREEYQKKKKDKEPKESDELTNEELDFSDEDSWIQDLHHILTKELSFDQFERLTQRLLRESGFVQVEVTGRTGDQGIDGKGIARLHGFMSFHVIFQCKKYQGSVSASELRDFRGAMVGRADKGLFITTGTFSPAAIREATRDGAPPIDLVDGEQLAKKLKDLGLGVQTEMVEKITVDGEWFKKI